MSIFFLGMATLLAGASVFWVLGRRRPRPPGTWAMSALLAAFALFLASYAPLAEGVLDTAVPHGSRILGDCASLGATAAVLAVSLQLNLGPAEARRLIKARLKWMIAALAGVVALLAYEQATRHSAHAYAFYMLVYICVIGATDVNFVVQALRQVGRTRRTAVRIGLRTAAVGTGFALIHLGYITFRLLDLGLDPALISHGDRCTSLSAVRCAAGVTSPALAVVLICLGLTLPAVAYPIRHMRQRRWEKASFEALTPLWRDLAEAVPHIVLSPARPIAGSTPDSDTSYHLQRRVIEISDGILALRPYRSRSTQEAASRTFTSGTDRAAAAIEAAVVKAALADLAVGHLAHDVAPPPKKTAARKDLRADTDWLLQVAHAYTRPVDVHESAQLGEGVKRRTTRSTAPIPPWRGGSR
ncbi:MAB_1171c family putative transporter [Streptomyces sp. NPDC048567]|uniref:MAB_1171c family putative transporter n=1 Tax=Streptomyces sp. NPDC048567 TaxID=3365570 RepID=UPI003714D84C